MSSVRKIMRLAIGAALMLGAGGPPVLASSATISFTGRSPTICRVSLSSAGPAVLRAGENTLGTTDEFCNSVDGYRVVLTHPAGLVDAWITVDGQRVDISPSATSTIIIESPHPGEKTRQLGLHLPEEMSQMPAVGLRAEARGMIF